MHNDTGMRLRNHCYREKQLSTVLHILSVCL
jgi:hypothetical protein